MRRASRKRQLTNTLARPEFPLVLACVFAAVFTRSFFATERPVQVFYFLFAAWSLSIILLFVMTRDQHDDNDDDNQSAD